MGVTENWGQTLPSFPQAAKELQWVWRQGPVITRQAEMIKWNILGICYFRCVFIKWGRGMGGTLQHILESSPYFWPAKDEIASPDLTCTPHTIWRGLGQKWGFNHLPNMMTRMQINAVIVTTCNPGLPTCPQPLVAESSQPRQGSCWGSTEVGVLGITVPLYPTHCPVWP